ncbi:MAG: SUMF1/EgtB/PvdO family nonheme iron enzyme [Chlamydiota bacterium]
MEKRVLGDYNIIKQIGQGSLGTVYLAEQRFMKRQYVLKVLPEELATDRSFIQRFEEGVKYLVPLDHTNLVKIHNVSCAQGVYFLVTDCVVDSIGETSNLAQYFSTLENGFREETLVKILHQIASALDYVHSKPSPEGVLFHGGLKLNNILLGSSKNSVDAYLSDCGLSKIIGAGAVLSRTYKVLADALGAIPVVTSKGGEERYATDVRGAKKQTRLQASFLQNFSFLAPEQKALGVQQQVGPEADVYAFGVLAYYLLTRKFPEGCFEMPSAFKSDYTLNWDRVVKRCLHPNPTKRPQSLVDLMDSALYRSTTVSVEQHVSQQHSVSNQLSPIIEQQETVQEESLSQPSPQFTAVQVELPKPSDGEEPYSEAEKIAVQQVVVPVEGDKDSVHTETFEAEKPQPLKPLLQTQHIERPIYEQDPAAVFRTETTIKHYQPEPQEKKNIEPILTDMVIIKGGPHYRGGKAGNRDESPRHEIYIDSFAIDIHPVTNEQFIRFLDVMGGEKDSNNNDMIRIRESRINKRSGKLSIESGYNKHPVVGVTWYGAVAYAQWVGKRLPTEAEWEVAARGGNDDNIYCTGNNIEKSQANFFSSDTTVVTSYAPNEYGLYDMTGNVYEWCQDWYGYNYYEVSAQEPDNPKGPLQGVYRVLRGGCWKSLKEDMRCSHRHRNNPGTINRTYGFRCAANVINEE